MTKTLLCILVLTGVAAAQPIGAGVKLGTTLTDAISSLPSFPIPNSNHFIVGPYVEVRLPLGLAVEGDALYMHDLYENAASAPIGSVECTTCGSGSTWQFPILLKYKFLKCPIRPYVEGGPAFSHISDISEIPSLNHRTNFGVVLGGGIEVKLFKLRISPEIRYNGYTLTNIEDPSGLFRSNRNLATFTTGIGF